MALVAFNSKPTDAQLKWFGCVWLPLSLVAIGCAVWLKAGVDLVMMIAASLTAVSILLAAIAPRSLKPAFVGLLVVTFPIGFVVSHVMMAMVFFALVTPLALALRLFGHDALSLRFEKDAKSYWIPHAERAPVTRYFRQF